MAKQLRADVAEKYELAGLKEAGLVYDTRSQAEIDLSQLEPKQASELVVNGFPYLRLKTKEERDAAEQTAVKK